MEFKIVERYDPVTLTKGSQVYKTKFSKKIRQNKDNRQHKKKLTGSSPAGNYMFKVNNRNTRARC